MQFEQLLQTIKMSRRRLIPSAAVATATLAAPGLLFRQAASTAAQTATFFNSSTIRDITATFNQDEYDAMIATFQETSHKEWIHARLRIDGATLENAGMRLKGNSSLGGLGGGERGPMVRIDGEPAAEGTPPAGQGLPAPSENPRTIAKKPDIVAESGGAAMDEASEETPERLPWLVSLDKFVDRQEFDGLTQFVIRSNLSKTSLNEAVALELLSAAGLASQKAAAARFQVGDSDPTLRLVIEHPNDAWMAEHFSPDGLLFKAEAMGSWDYRGDDPSLYSDSFDLEAGGSSDDTADYAPLLSLLDFLNNSDDAAFTAELPSRLDIEQFAVYLAMMELIGNDDDIDGPGNNAYLYFDPSAGRFTVVPWDMNLAFRPGGGLQWEFAAPENAPGAAGTPEALPDGAFQPPVSRTNENGAATFGEAPAGVGGRGANPLVGRFNEREDWTALVSGATERLRTSLFASGQADSIMDRWVELLETQAGDLVDVDTIGSESAAVREYFTTT